MKTPTQRAERAMTRVTLECDGTLVLAHTYRPSAYFFDDGVIPSGPPDHWAEMLGLGGGQVNESQKSWRRPVKSLDFRHRQ